MQNLLCHHNYCMQYDGSDSDRTHKSRNIRWLCFEIRAECKPYDLDCIKYQMTNILNTFMHDMCTSHIQYSHLKQLFIVINIKLI